MFSRLTNAFNHSTTPSALLILGKLGATIYILHLLPEKNTIERFSLTTSSSATVFNYGGATEQAREQIGTVTLHIGDGETANSFIDDIATRIRKLRNDLPLTPAHQQTEIIDVAQLMQDVLRPAVIDAIRERETRERSKNATQVYPVFIIYVRRSRAGMILNEPTSFPS